MHDHELKERFQTVEQKEGSGTELVSLSIPAGKTLQSVRSRIEQEYASAENIKSDHTRSNVRDALSRVKRILTRYDQTPEQGLVVYVGRVDGELEEFVFDDLPQPVSASRYTCSNRFFLDPIEHIITPDNSYGLLVVERGGAAIGRLSGDQVTTLHSFESMVMGKTKAGGQSSVRFERERERQKHEFFQKVAEIASSEFIEDDLAIDGLLLGGPNITVDEFQKGEYLDYRLRDAVLGSHGVDTASSDGLRQLVDRGSQEVLSAEREAVREAVESFYRGLKGEGDVSYGVDACEQAIQYGAVETLLITESHPTDRISELQTKVENRGGELLVVSEDFEQGQQLETGFGGIAALLRFPV